MSRVLLVLAAMLSMAGISNAQLQHKAWSSTNLLQTNYFIENKGQFDAILPEKRVLYGVQHRGDEFMFGPEGYSIKVSKRLVKEEEHKKSGEKEAEVERKTIWLDVVWLNCNKNVEIVHGKTSTHYFTYGDSKFNAYGYESLTYKNLYNNIDVEYKIHPASGIEYILHLKPGAKLEEIKFQYRGKKINTQLLNDCITVNNAVKPIYETALSAFYTEQPEQKLNIHYKLTNNVVSFVSDEHIDIEKAITVDPWVTAITTLSGGALMDNIGYDVDYDALGNLYVLGGGGATGTAANAYPKIAKYDINGNLLWTFSGVLAAPVWNSSPGATQGYERVGNFVVNKISSKCYFSQGLNVGNGSSIIRLNPAGNYDNFITIANSQFEEVWEMKFDCNTSKVMGFGGGTTSNINFGTVDTTSGVVNSINISGNPGSGQDVINATIGPNGEVYMIMVNNSPDMFRLNATNTNFVWNTASGATLFSEQGNKPYSGNFAFSNGYNCLAANQTYLFFYDGSVLKAFSTTTGTLAGTIALNGNLNQGGICTNSCDEVYIGGNNGNIIKYFFNGANFVLQGTLTIPGQQGKSAHDLVYNSISNVIYACGDNYVAVVDPNTTCLGGGIGNLNLVSNSYCPNNYVGTITNPTATSNYSYVWQDSITGVILQSSGPFTGVYADTFSANITSTLMFTAVQISDCQVVSNSIYINPLFCNSLNVDLCPGQTYMLSNGTVINSSGTYPDTLQSTLGFDSIINVVVVVHPANNITQNVSACAGQNYTLPNGNVVNTAGTYLSNFTNVYGCDSIITTNLAYFNPTAATVYDTICSNQNYSLPNGQIVSSAGTYTTTINNVNGCDSVVTTHLFEINTSSASISASICQGYSYTLPDLTQVSLPGSYTVTLTNSVGCDSIITVNLATIQSSFFNQNPTICSNQSFTLPGGTSTNIMGTYQDTLTNSLGCDSVITTALNVVQLPSLNLPPDTGICVGDFITLDISISNPNASYLWENNSVFPARTINSSGTYYSQISAPPCPIISDTFKLTVANCKCDAKIPNAFSPNGDNANDFFKPIINCIKPLSEYKFKVYNRWGQLLFETKNQDQSWDGYFKERLVESAVYFYFVEYVNPISQEKVLYKGDVTVVR